MADTRRLVIAYKTKVHYGNDYWWSIISFEVPTKDELIEVLVDYKTRQGSGMADEEFESARTVINTCPIPQGVGTEYCDTGFIKITDI